MFRTCHQDALHAIVYFYFDFNDINKRTRDHFLRSLLTQISEQSGNIPDALNAVYSCSQDGRYQPSSRALLSATHGTLAHLSNACIVIDALDECKEREELLEVVEDIISWKLGLRILITSRREKDIEDTLKPLLTTEICVNNDTVDTDIRIYVRESLRNDPKMKRWPESVRKEIETTLMKGANGMFQWVVCQLLDLRKCLTLEKLRKALKSLPKNLDDTYARILLNIDDNYSVEAHKVLQWLVLSARPMRLAEIAEVVAFDTEDDPHLNSEKRLLDSRDILKICSSLADVTTSTAEKSDHAVEEELRLAHFSVKDYLISDRIMNGPASFYAIDLCDQHIITEMCLTYLLQFQEPNSLTSNTTTNFPLSQYAARYWPQHAQKADQYSTSGTGYLPVLKRILSRKDAFINWVRLCNLDAPWEQSNIQLPATSIASPLYYMSLAGLSEAGKFLMDQGADVNARGGKYGYPLQAAALQGNEITVWLLLENGADINLQGGHYCTALQAAVCRGDKAIVQLLLDKGADLDIRGGDFGSALMAAAFEGNSEMLLMLVDNGADVNETHDDSYCCSPLQAFVSWGDEATVQLLLAKGADLNMQGGDNGNVLQAAAYAGNAAVVRLLLEKGMDVNVQGGLEFNTALQAAANQSDEIMVRLLLDNGADVNIRGGWFDNALQAAAAAYKGSETVMQLLLDRGADINAQGGLYGNALQAAANEGDGMIMRLLLDNGADVNIQGGIYGNALQAAANEGDEMIVRLLLDNGADVNIQGGRYGNALQAAIERKESEAVVHILLERGADLNA